MNLTNGKTIDVNLSSLLSLKAELLRKQTEVNKVKLTLPIADNYMAHKKFNITNEGSAENFVSNKKHDKKQRAKLVNKTETATVCEHEDTALLEKSQRILEAKSRFYERMSRTGGKLNSDDNCLVLFNRKRQEEQLNETEVVVNEQPCTNNNDEIGENDDSASDDYDNDEDWVEYTDCLGRTRKCLRQDLDNVKRRDKELADGMPERLDQSKANWSIRTKISQTTNDDNDGDDSDEKFTTNNFIGPMPTESVYSDGCSFISKHEEQRINWERKERENIDKVDVHYQDVFFDEARQHGVGYYAFSTDEEERRRQQHQLDEARQETINEQDSREKLREQREKIISQRVIAAKNRQRARMGLPPLDEIEELSKLKKEKEKNEKKLKKSERREEKRKQKAEKIEQQCELERKQQLRPWDEGKKDVGGSSNNNKSVSDEQDDEWTYKPERLPLSQEEWNERKRDERYAEFAPTYDNKKINDIKLKRTNFTSMPPPPLPVQVPPSLASTEAITTSTSLPSKEKIKNYQMVPTTTTSDKNFASFQSSKREKRFQRRNYNSQNDNEKVFEHVGTTIAPPENLEVYLPSKSKKSKTNNELEQSIEAGLRFLRDNCDKGTMSTKDSWTAKADY